MADDKEVPQQLSELALEIERCRRCELECHVFVRELRIQLLRTLQVDI